MFQAPRGRLCAMSPKNCTAKKKTEILLDHGVVFALPINFGLQAAYGRTVGTEGGTLRCCKLELSLLWGVQPKQKRMKIKHT